MKCPECSAENMEGSDSCWSCNQALKAAPEQVTRSNWMLWSVGTGAAVLLGVLVLAATSTGGGGGGGATISAPGSTATVTVGTTGTPSAGATAGIAASAGATVVP